MKTLAGLLDGVNDASQPLVTYYDLATGERIELSTVTTANWVAKTANFLVDDLDAAAGTRIRFEVPSHWQTFVWLLAAWHSGCVVTDAGADIVLVGPEPAPAEDNDVRVALSFRPLATPFVTPPAGCIDFNAEAPGQSDYFLPADPPDSTSLALAVEGQEWTHSDLLEMCAPESARRLFTPQSLRADADALISALRGGGSLVLVDNGSAEQREAIAANERTSH